MVMHPNFKCPARQEDAPPRSFLPVTWLMLMVLVLFKLAAYAQDAAPAKQDPASVNQAGTTGSDKDALKVNWLYGSFVPKEVPFIPLTPHQRWKLYLRATYTTWGIYVKTGLFTISDQIENSPSQWGRGFDGFAKRLGTRQAQFVIQNSLNHYGNAVVGWEPRYDRCHCNGFWPRTRHSIVRNFVTYGGAEQALRPQIMPYAAAFGGGATVATWLPGANVVVKGYQAAVTQVAVGIGANWLAEFAPEITHALHLKKRVLN